MNSLRKAVGVRFSAARLYVIVTAAQCRRDWLETASAAIDGGAGVLQLREPDLDDRELLDRARRLVALCKARNVMCIINDRADVARLAEADGVHVGQGDLPVADVRNIMGEGAVIGLSTHSDAELADGITRRPDYIAVGPMFESKTKALDVTAGPALLQRATAATDIPILPIGGISAERVGELATAGAQRVCVCHAVIGADDPAAAAAAIVLRLRKAIKEND